MFFILVVWYRFLYDVWIVFILIFIVGFGVGVVFINVFVVVLEIDFRFKEFVMGFVIIGMGVGIFCVGVVGLFMELVICDYCLFVLDVGDYCFMRFFGGWN